MTSESLTLDQIKQKAIHGVISLTFRRVVLLFVTSIVTNLYLARILPQSVIGTFNLANSVVAFFGFFSDIGLAASIIQQKGEITDEDLATTFTIQELLVGTITVALFLAAPAISNHYHFGDQGPTLIRALAISFFLVSFKVIPSVIAERNLNFRPLVTVEIIETVIFNGLLVLFVLQGFGLLAYAIAQITRSVIGVMLLFNLSPWKVRLQYTKVSAQKLLKFGIPYQANSLLALLKDRLIALVVGGMITLEAVGYVTMAQFIAFIPLEIMNIIIRVTFPTYSKLQDDRQVLAHAVDRSLYVMGLLLYPGVFGVLALIPNLVALVGIHKWGPIIPMVYLFSVTTLFSSISTTFTNVFNAVGEIKITLRLMIMWTTLEWLFTPLLVLKFGYIGVALSSAIIACSSVMTIFLMRQIAPIHLWDSIAKPIAASIIMALILLPLGKFFLSSKLMILPLSAVGAVIYFAIMFTIDRKRILFEVKEVLGAIR